MEASHFVQFMDHLFGSFAGILLMTAVLWACVSVLLACFMPSDDPWKPWEGSIITAIKRAEKALPSNNDDAPGSQGLAKLDMAQELVLEDYAKANRGKKPSKALIEQLRQAIQVKHHGMDSWGSLSRK